jgi:hypothetical protein
MSRRAVLLLSFYLAGASSALAEDLPSAPVPSQPAPQGSLRGRLEALEKRSALDEHVKGVLEQARRALEQAHTAKGAGDVQASQRAEGVADAALTLAERLTALSDERALSRAAAERTRMAIARRKAAEQALAQERARLAELTARESR